MRKYVANIKTTVGRSVPGRWINGIQAAVFGFLCVWLVVWAYSFISEANNQTHNVNVALNHALLDGRASKLGYRKADNPDKIRANLTPAARADALTAVIVDHSFGAVSYSAVSEAEENARWLFGGAAIAFLYTMRGLANCYRSWQKEWSHEVRRPMPGPGRSRELPTSQ